MDFSSAPRIFSSVANNTKVSSAPLSRFREINFAAKGIILHAVKVSPRARNRSENRAPLEDLSWIMDKPSLAFSSFPMYIFMPGLKFKCRSGAQKKGVWEQRRRRERFPSCVSWKTTTLNWAKLVRERAQAQKKARDETIFYSHAEWVLCLSPKPISFCFVKSF